MPEAIDKVICYRLTVLPFLGWLPFVVAAASTSNIPSDIPRPTDGAINAVSSRRLPLRLADAGWRSLWSDARGVPSRLWGPAPVVPGATQSATIAADLADAFLAANRSWLAPGSTPTSFRRVTNQLDRHVRTIGYVQQHDGVPVIGGQISFRIVGDRIALVVNDAWPNVEAPTNGKRAQAAVVLANVRAALATPRAEIVQRTSALVPVGAPHDRRYVRGAELHVVDGALAWTVFVADDGTVLGARAQHMYGTATLRGAAAPRWPGGGRVDVPLSNMDVVIGGETVRTDATGLLSWSGNAGTARVAPQGTYVVMQNAAGELAAPELGVADSGTATWTTTNEADDSQLQTFVHAQLARQFALTLAPALPFLQEPVQVTVNIDDQCNAYSNGTGIFFFRSSSQCENTARLADVVYHEYAHSVHRHAIIEGVGAYDGAMGEGLADVFAVSLTGDPQMGVGFFYSALPLRDLNPADEEARWPDDIGGIHTTGKIIGGAMWDLREALRAALGDAEGRARSDAYLYALMQRSTDVPTSLLEVLVQDDDDGDLMNGTPNECLIRDAFGRHGLRGITGEITAPGAVVAEGGQVDAEVQLTLYGQSAACAGDEITAVEATWSPGVGSAPAAGSAPAEAIGPLTFSARIPLPPPGGKTRYRLRAVFADGSTQEFPGNRADPSYELTAGETIALYCTTFDERDPFTEGWQQASEGGVPFEWGAATRGTSTTDPAVAFSGTNIIGLGLGRDYAASQRATLTMPPVDVGNYSDVHLQFRRWLAVEDGFFDQATIRVGDAVAWQNVNSEQGDASSTHAIDREWRYQDVALTPWATSSELNVAFDLVSDQGLHFGGWSLDDVCIVANAGSICGDGLVTPTEACDDGAANSLLPDACRPTCRRPSCGDGVLDSGECAAQGFCAQDCGVSIGGGGCRSGQGLGWLMLTMVGLYAARARRQAAALSRCGNDT